MKPSYRTLRTSLWAILLTGFYFSFLSIIGSHDLNAQTASIGDMAWFDQNGNGMVDVSEIGIEGITVILTLPDGSDLLAISDQNGMYSFNELESGLYMVVFSDWPPGLEPSTPTFYSIMLGEGENFEDADLGLTVGVAECGDFLLSSVNTTPASCGAEDGSITIEVQGGTEPYSVSVNNGPFEAAASPTITLTDLPAGDYYVVVADDATCSSDLTLGINSEGSPQVGLDVPSLTCEGSDQTIVINVEEPTGETVEVSIGEGTELSLEVPGQVSYELSPGDYTVTVTPPGGCDFSEEITIQEPEEVEYQSFSNDPTECEAADGSVSVTVSGGSGDFSLSVGSQSSDGLTVDGLAAGSYAGVLTDNGCNETYEFTVELVDPEDCEGGGGVIDCNETINVCTPLQTSFEFCVEDCEGDNLEIAGHSGSLFGCSIYILEGDTCFRYTPLPAFSGEDLVVVEACSTTDPDVCYEYVFNVNVGECGPILENDTINSIVNEQLMLDLLENDYHPEDLSMNLTDVSDPSSGLVDVDLETGIVTYTPEPGFEGPVTFTYTVCDENNLCETALVVIFVEAASSCLADAGSIGSFEEDCFILGSTFTSPEVTGQNTDDGFLHIYLITTDLDPADFVEYNIVGISTDGNFDTQSLNLIEGDYEIHSFSFEGTLMDLQTAGYLNGEQVLDDIASEAICADLTVPGVAITVDDDCEDDDPPNEDCEDEITECAIQQETSTVCLAFCDILGSGHVIDTVFNTFGCSVNAVGDTCVDYTPLPGFPNGLDSIIAVACGPIGCDTVTAYFNVGCTAPTAIDDFSSTMEGETVFIDVLNNDSHECDWAFNLNDIFEQPANGFVNINDDGVNYTPNDGFVGEDTFQYIVCPDMCDNCQLATVTVTVTGDPDTPEEPLIAEPDLITTVVNELIEIDVLSNDSGEGDLTITDFSIPLNGTLTLSDDGTHFIYTPNEDYEGPDYFSYTICDELGNCETTWVQIDVIGADSPPVGNNSFVEVNPGVPSVIFWEETAYDPDGGDLTISIIEEPECGTLIFSSDSTALIYDPGMDCYGNFSYTYEVCDEDGNCIELTVLVAVGEGLSNNPPELVSDTLYVDEAGGPEIHDIGANDIDADGDNIIYSLGGNPLCGEAEIDPDGFLLYTPAEECDEPQDVIMIIGCDEGMPPACDTSFVFFDYENIPPSDVEAVPDFGNTDDLTPMEICVLENDLGNGIIVFDFFNFSGPGTLDFDEETMCFLYTPEPGQTGDVIFNYIIMDGAGNSSQTIVTITVVPAGENLPPVANSDTETTDVNVSIDIPVLDNDYDPEGQEITLTQIFELDNLPEGIDTLIINDDGTITLIPEEDFTGEVFFSYEICDEENLCDVAEVVVGIGVDVSNNPPVANDDFVSITLGMDTVICFFENDFDPNMEDAISLEQIMSGPFNGSYEITEDSCLLYTPNADFIGIDYITYQICDDGMPVLCDEAVIEITVGVAPGDTVVIAQDDFVEVEFAEETTVNIINNDNILPGGLDFVIEVIQDPQNGIYVLTGNGTSGASITYDPNSGFEGVDSLQYILCTPDTDGICDTAWVYFEVNFICDLEIPNGISPNGDSMMDFWSIPNIESCFPENREVTIFNRWGNEVYSKSGFSSSDFWDGTWQNNGKDVPDGTYFYVIKARSPEGGEIDQAGYIEVFR